MNAIAQLNDTFRRSLGTSPDVPGRVLMTRYLASLPADVQANLLQLVRTFDDFTTGGDPYGEHDFGQFTFYIPGDRADELIFFKIDYYESNDPDACGSDHPDDPAQSYRVLTVMLASEY